MNIMVIVVLIMFFCFLIGSFFLIVGVFDEKFIDIALIMFIICGICSAICVYDMYKNPQPTFREVCEANNGTYIDNNGSAGDSCIYNKGGE